MTAQFPTRKIATLTGHNGPVHAVTYSAGLSQYVLTGSSDRSIRLFNPARVSPSSSGLVQTYSAHGYEVLDISVADDNARFVSGGGDKTVFVWDVPTARTQRRFAGHAGRVNAVAWGAGGDVVLSGSYDGTVKLWDTKSQAWKAMMTMSEAKDSVSSLCVLEHEIIAGSIDGRVRTYDLRMGMVYVDVIGHPVTSITPTKQGDSLLVSSLDSSLRLMDRPNGKLLQSYKATQYKNADYRVRSTLGINDSVVLSGSEDGSVYVWDLLEGEVLHRLRHGESRDGAMGSTKKDVVSAVTFSKARREWASAGGDGDVIIWGIDDY